MVHIRSVHEKEVRKMFVIDASEHLEADGEYHMWMNAITDVNKDKDVITDLENTNRVLLKRVNEENKHTCKKLSKNKGIIETERVIHSEDGRTKKGVVKEQFAKVTKRKSFDAENIDPDNRKKRANNQRHQSEKVQNVLEHFAGDDSANKASILASIIDKQGSDFAASIFSKSTELKQIPKLTPESGHTCRPTSYPSLPTVLERTCPKLVVIFIFLSSFEILYQNENPCSKIKLLTSRNV